MDMWEATGVIDEKDGGIETPLHFWSSFETAFPAFILMTTKGSVTLTIYVVVSQVNALACYTT